MLNRKILHFVTHFFVQDENSKLLLASIGIKNVTVSGDTRFDRVATNAEKAEQFDRVEAFCSNSKIFIAGSTWPDDERLISHLIKKYTSWKFIIAPHEIKEEKITSLLALLGMTPTVRYSAASDLAIEPRVLIIDNIGMLSSLYQYGGIAYIGGGFGAGIHNTLEAAAFGLPVIFGPNYQKFNEAKALLAVGAGFTVSNEAEIDAIMNKLQDEPYRKAASNLAKEYVQQQRGATGIIMKYLDSIVKH